jgi:hypothetical protein
MRRLLLLSGLRVVCTHTHRLHVSIGYFGTGRAFGACGSQRSAASLASIDLLSVEHVCLIETVAGVGPV